MDHMELAVPNPIPRELMVRLTKAELLWDPDAWPLPASPMFHLSMQE